MSRIKKRGLDYFPLNTDFMHDRLVRRIMKREGDGSFAILLGALSCIYALIHLGIRKAFQKKPAENIPFAPYLFFGCATAMLLHLVP